MSRLALSFAAAAALLTVATTAHAHYVEIYGHTACVEGEPVVGWDVMSWDSSGGNTHDDIRVEASFDGNTWTLVDLGVIASPDFGFSGSMFVTGAATVRLRAIAKGPWDDGYWWEAPRYADGGSIDAADATEFVIPTDCAPPPPTNPGTGTPGYWRNHPEAWPVDSIDLGGVTYTRDEAIALLSTPAKGDKSYTMVRAVIAAVLNVTIGNDSSCIDATLASAHDWLAVNPAGSGVKGSSDAWAEGEPLATTLDDYNNGRLCAPHRD